MDMCTEKDNEELVEALVTAARAAFLSLKETTQEHFYCLYNGVKTLALRRNL